jgi:hypothetical protein
VNVDFLPVTVKNHIGCFDHEIVDHLVLMYMDNKKLPRHKPGKVSTLNDLIVITWFGYKAHAAINWFFTCGKEPWFLFHK